MCRIHGIQVNPFIHKGAGKDTAIKQIRWLSLKAVSGYQLPLGLPPLHLWLCPGSEDSSWKQTFVKIEVPQSQKRPLLGGSFHQLKEPTSTFTFKTLIYKMGFTSKTQRLRLLKQVVWVVPLWSLRWQPNFMSFSQEIALVVGAFSVIVKLQTSLPALVSSH